MKYNLIKWKNNRNQIIFLQGGNQTVRKIKIIWECKLFFQKNVICLKDWSIK